MRYRSTSRKAPLSSLRGAVLRGLAPDGGLYMPAEIARHSAEELEEFRKLPFTEVCFRVVKPFATPDVPEEVLWQIVSEAINFPVRLVSLSPGLHILELFHGPTLAFKDFGARFMARLMGYFVRGESRPLTVLVATSGDTGSAVAHGFLGVPGIRVVILYPSKRISEAQEKQFTTLGENITALEVGGTFDDCQRLVDLCRGRLEYVQKEIWGHAATDEETLCEMRKVHERFGYLADPHTAVGVYCWEAYKLEHAEPAQGLVLATAHPAKFADVVRKAIGSAPPLPDRLAAYLKRDTLSLPISSSYDDFKQFLLAH